MTVTFPTCPADGFPMIDLGGSETCSVEYADTAIGGQTVTNAKIIDGYLHLFFGNGASVPLTCPCCGGHLHLRNISLDALSRMLAGRTLEGFRHGEWVSKSQPPERHPIFALQFSGEEDLNVRTVQVHLDSVRRITERVIPTQKSSLND